MSVQTVEELLSKYRRRLTRPQNPRKVIFNNVIGYDVYNPTVPFLWNNETYIIGRVEKRDSEESEAVFFTQETDGTFSPKSDAPRFRLQDPFVSFIDDGILFGGTETFPHSHTETTLQWRTNFYFGKSVHELREFCKGPDGMKDIRLVQLKDKRLGVFSRPQGEKGGRGKIGFTIIKDLSLLNAEVILNAPLLEQFNDDEWGGCNEAILLPNGKIGVLGHVAKFSSGYVRHYYPMAFTIDPDTAKFTQMQILAERSDFLPGDSKREDLKDVLFSAGLVRHKDGSATLYTGVSDAEVQAIEIPDPFLC